jgi:predicted nucleic acid-binding protein
VANRSRGPVAHDAAEALLLDAEGLSKAADADPAVRAFLLAAALSRTPVVVSAITLTETLRGHHRDAKVHGVLGGCCIEPVSAELGRAAGELLGRTGRKDTVDAVIAVTAAKRPGSVRVLTSDPSDLRALTEDFPGVNVEAV